MVERYSELSPVIGSIVESCLHSQPAKDQEIRKIFNWLDQLALALNLIDEYTGEIEDTSEEPPYDYQSVRDKITKRFPDWGFYNECNSVTSEIATTELIVGDAIDDIADIVLELLRVQWFAENVSEHEALWHLHFGFKHHWEDHLLGAKRYIAALKFETQL